MRAPAPPTSWRRGVLVLAGYLAASMALWWPTWSRGPTRRILCMCGDPGQYLWFLAAPAQALAHGHNPFFTSGVLYPGGTNLLDNPGVVGLGIALAPVTWLWGPVASLNVALTLAPALTAFTAYLCLRRWAPWRPAAVVGGLLYGFSPFVVGNLLYSHLQAAFLAFLPLVALCLDELLRRQQWRPVWTGALLAAVLAAQFLVSSELFTVTVLFAALATVGLLLAGLLTDRPGTWARLPHAATGALAALAVGVLLLGYPAWFALAGPRHVSGGPWSFVARTGTDLGDVLLLPPSASRPLPGAALYGYFGNLGPPLTYLGIPLTAACAAAVVVWRKVRVLWFAAAMVLVSGALSAGLAHTFAHPPTGWRPWRLFDRLPLVNQISPSRMFAVTGFFVAAIVAVALDRLWEAGPTLRAGRPWARLGPRGWAAVTLAVAALTLAPLASSYQVPPVTRAVSQPAWFAAEPGRLPPHAVLLVLPWANTEVQAWEALDGFRYSIIGGDANAPTVEFPAARTTLTGLSYFAAPPALDGRSEAGLRRALSGWGATEVVVVATPEFDPSYALAFLSATLGGLPSPQDGAWVWTDPGRGQPPVGVAPTTATGCRLRVGTGAPALALARCFLEPPPVPTGG